MKAMILAAGRGLRMRPLTDHTHKGLLKVSGETLLERHIKGLAAVGVKDIVINVSYLADQIQGYLGRGDSYGVHIHYSVEAYPLEVGGGLIKALPLLGKDPFMVVNCDVWTDYSYERLKRPYPGVLGHIILVDNPPHHPTGDFGLLHDKVTVLDFANTQVSSSYTYAGIAVYDPSLFEGFTKSGAQPLLPILKKAIAANQLSGEYYSGTWMDVGTPERLRELHHKLN